MKLTLLPSEKGDCLLIESGGVAILADGGMPASYAEEVRPFLGAWAKAGGVLDLLYVSHVDQDHIGGVLRLLEDMVEWRVHNFKRAKGKASRAPGFDEPPPVKRIWHNSFKALVPQNAGEIGTMLAARANTFSSSSNPSVLKLAASYRNIAASIPEAVKVSRRIAADQLAIPLNREFGGKLAMVRDDEKKPIKLKRGSALAIRVLGPFEKDLTKLRDYWNAWLQDVENARSVKSLEKWLDEKGGAISASGAALTIDDEIGRRNRVSQPNLASLMLLLEEKKPRGRIVRVLLTGDGHHVDVLDGLKHHDMLADGAGLHVDVLKIQHHGSEHNMNRDFAKRITADHYVFCANGEHENPDLRILEVLLDSRLDGGDKRSSNAEAVHPFTVWLNCSVAYLDRKLAALVAGRSKGEELKKARDHMVKVEKALADGQVRSGGRMSVKLLDPAPLVLEI